MPVYDSHLLTRSELNIGRDIRAERQRRRITLEGMAHRTKLSTACLSQIENDQRAIDICQALAIADALGIPVLSLFASDSSTPYQVTRDDEIRSRSPREAWVTSMRTGERRQHANAFWPLADLFVDRQLEPMLEQVKATPDRVRFCHHHEHEFTFVLKGSIQFQIRTPEGLRQEELFQGDCVYLRSSLPHCLSSLTSTPAETLQVFSSSSSRVHMGPDWSSPLGVGLLEDDDDNGLGARIGREIAFLRLARGWSIAYMATLLEVKESHLKQIECGERAASVATLMTLARTLEKPLHKLIRDPRVAGPYYTVQRSNELARLQPMRRSTPVNQPTAQASNQFFSLASGYPAQDMYPYFVRIPNIARESLALHEHHGQEFFYVLQGQVDLTTRKDGREHVEVLKTGDCAYLDSTVPHVLRGQTRNPYSSTSAEVIVVFGCSLGESYLFDK
jgi:transcriptional regulator with XRE-family HTH domain